jgi:endonuclease-3 related protein
MRAKLNSIYKKLLKKFGPQDWWPGDTPFEIAVGAVLTQNTNWGNVERAIKNLKRARSLNAKRIHAMSHPELAELIRPAGYFNVKSKRLKNFVGFLVEEHGGSMKRMRRGGLEELRHSLLTVNGVGPETADSILLYALEKPTFVIDAYTKRALSRHAFLPIDESYEDYRTLFMENLAPDVGLYNEYHALFVALGKHLCRPRNPLCDQCPLEGLMS